MRVSVLLSVLSIAFAGTVGSSRAAPAQTRSRNAAWRADLDTLTKRILRVHPRPFAHTTRTAFDARVVALRSSIPRRTDAQLLAGFMQLVASIEDGHTYLTSLGARGARWYPVRVHLFADGLWITGADSAHAALAGQRVVRIGRLGVDSALARIRTVSAGDNALGQREGAALLSNAVLLDGLGIVNGSDSVAIETERDGIRRTITLRSISTPSGAVDWPQFGEITGPSGITFVTAFGGRTAAGYREPSRNTDLPLHLRGRRAYWWTVLPSDSTVYFAFSNVVAKSSYSRFTLLEELEQALAHVDSAPSSTSRFIFDLRYNSGGDGTLTPAIVNAFVKRDASIGRRGRLFVITGRKTFSAGAGTVLDLVRHTSAILVGEPMGVGFNASGDAGTSTLPHSGIGVSISTNTTYSSNLEGVRVVPVRIPATMRGVDYFAGRDPAIDAILSEAAPYTDVPAVLERVGGEAARARWRAMQAQHGAASDSGWWEPFTFDEMNRLSYRLLDEKRTNDAIAGFELNRDRHPRKWESWDSLGDGYRAAGRSADARAAYARALQVAPDNWNAEHQRRMMRELQGPGGDGR